MSIQQAAHSKKTNARAQVYLEMLNAKKLNPILEVKLAAAYLESKGF
jgi:hypothetical protein